MRNSKFVRRLIVIIAVFLALCAFLDFALYPCTFMRNDVHAVATEHNDVLLLGPSNMKMGVDPDIMLEGTGLSGHNACCGGEYPIDALYLTKLAVEKQDPKVVLFELAPGAMVTEKEKGNNYLLFYHEFPLSRAKLSYATATLGDSDLRALLFPFYEYTLSYEIAHAKETIARKASRDYSIDTLRDATQEYHENGYIEKYPVDMAAFPAWNPELFTVDACKQTNMDALTDLIAYCKKQDIRFVAVTMPMPDGSLAVFPENYEAAWTYFGDYFAKQDVEYLNFNKEYYDYAPHAATDFVDFDGHLNGDAARAFSATLGDLLFAEP